MALAEMGIMPMRAIRQSVVAIFLGVLWVVNLAQAGEVKGKVQATGLKSAENIVVYIDAIPGKKFDHPSQHVAIDQRNMVFAPRTTVILQGTTVDFLNHDTVAHNVYWPSINGDKRFRHSMTIVSPNQQKSFEFDNVGTAQLLCNLHPEMIGYVVVVPTPYFAVTGNDGNFLIKDVPPGSYTLKTWSEDGKPTTQKITTADGTTSVELSVKK
jgi:plastocyanin